MSELERGDVVRYIGASGDQVAWGGNDDPRNVLVVEDTYVVTGVEVHSWHTKIKLRQFDGWFNSVHFVRSCMTPRIREERSTQMAEKIELR